MNHFVNKRKTTYVDVPISTRIIVCCDLYVVTHWNISQQCGMAHKKHPIEEEVGDVEQTLIFILQLINQSIGGKERTSMDTPISIRIIIYYD